MKQEHYRQKEKEQDETKCNADQEEGHIIQLIQLCSKRATCLIDGTLEIFIYLGKPLPKLIQGRLEGNAIANIAGTPFTTVQKTENIGK